MAPITFGTQNARELSGKRTKAKKEPKAEATPEPQQDTAADRVDLIVGASRTSYTITPLTDGCTVMAVFKHGRVDHFWLFSEWSVARAAMFALRDGNTGASRPLLAKAITHGSNDDEYTMYLASAYQPDPIEER